MHNVKLVHTFFCWFYQLIFLAHCVYNNILFFFTLLHSFHAVGFQCNGGIS